MFKLQQLSNSFFHTFRQLDLQKGGDLTGKGSHKHMKAHFILIKILILT